MAHIGHFPADQEMLARATAGLAELASGRFAERMRLDAAARLVMTIHRVLALRGAGMMPDPRPRPSQRRAVAEVERVAHDWNPASMTVREFVSELPPADVKVLIELSPIWADAMARCDPG